MCRGAKGAGRYPYGSRLRGSRIALLAALTDERGHRVTSSRQALAHCAGPRGTAAQMNWLPTPAERS